MSLFNVGFVIFPELTQLDLTGPQQILARLPQSAIPTLAGSRTVRRWLLSDSDIAFEAVAISAMWQQPQGQGFAGFIAADAGRWPVSVEPDPLAKLSRRGK